MSRVLIADDDKNLRYSLKRALERRGNECIEASNGQDAIARTRNNNPDVVVMDIKMPGCNGLEVLIDLKAIAPNLPVIIMTAYGTTETAIEAMKRGAFEYVLKPFDLGEMQTLITKAATQHDGDRRLLEPEQPSPGPRLVGNSPAMQKIYKAIGQVAESDIPILILGESGTGKELVAHTIHNHSNRANAPFLAINCAAIPETLFESELFGHEKGSFTGATETKTGLLESCHHGTVFLDEIAEIPLAAQAKLLRFLQEGEFIRLGVDKPIRVDVRVVAASNRDLGEAVAQKAFRDDLLYRLNTATIALPSLRERLHDLEEIVSYFIHRFNTAYGKSFTRISEKTLDMLRGQAWPGNVRELENMIRRGVVVGQGETIRPEHLFPQNFDIPNEIKTAEEKLETDVRTAIGQFMDTVEDTCPPLIPLVERATVKEVLERTHHNQARAARLLGISRNTLRARIAEFHLA